jgi:hypothetical protein
VPPSAASKRPTLAPFASVNAPRSCPKSSASARASGSAAQFRLMTDFVQGLRQHLLARAGLALDDHGGQAALEAALRRDNGVELRAHAAQALAEEQLVGVRLGLGAAVLGAPRGEPDAPAADEGERYLLGLKRL